MIEVINIRKSVAGILVGTIFYGASLILNPISAYAKTDSMGEIIIAPRTHSSLSIGYQTEDATHKDTGTKTIDTIIATPIGGFSASFGKTDGKQAIDPHEQNIVTNGAMPRDAYPLEEGSIEKLALGYGFPHLVMNPGLDLGLRIGYGSGKGKTDIGNTVPGFMQREESRWGGAASLKSIDNDLGISLAYTEGKREDQSRFPSARSIEDIGTEKLALAVSFPLAPKILSAELLRTEEKETSDVVYVDISAQDLLIPRRVSHDQNEVGVCLKLYSDFFAQKYLKLAVSGIDGSERHEFSAPDVDGYRIVMECGFGNNGSGHFLEPKRLLVLEYGKKTSGSYNEYPSTHPQAGPITIQFNEQKDKEWANISLRSLDDYTIRLGYERDERHGSTDALIQALGITQSQSKGELTFERLTLELEKELGWFAVGAKGIYDLEQKDTEIAAKVMCRF